MTRPGRPAAEADVARGLEREGLARWRGRARSGSPPPDLDAARKGASYEVTASRKGRSATLRLSARFAERLLADPDASCRSCADRFFERLFERLRD